MKKFRLFACLMLFSALTLYAQDNHSFRIGIAAGPSVSWLMPETRGFFMEGRRIGFSYGLIADLPLGEFYAINTGIHITHLGGKMSFDDRKLEQITRVERIYKLQYLELPLSLKMHTSEIGYFTYFGRFGFAPGINLRAEAEDSFVAGSNYMQEVDIKGQTPLIRAALIIALGAEYSLGGRVSLFGELMYNNGFTNNIKGEVLGVKPSANASAVQLNIGLLF